MGWTRRAFLGSVAGLTLCAGTYGVVEHACTEPDSRQTANYSPEKLGKGAVNIAVYGDSLSRGEGYERIDRQAWSMRTRRGGGWPLDSTTGPDSTVTLYERLLREDANLSLRLHNIAHPGAYVDPAVNQSPFVKQWVFWVRDFTGQISTTVDSSAPFPNLNILFAGHNNSDWYYDIDVFKLNSAEYIEELPKKTAKSFGDQLDRLLDKAKQQKYPVVVVVYGLINFESVFQARNIAMDSKMAHAKAHPELPELYPNSDVSKSFPSLLKDNQPQTVKIVQRINEEYQRLVEERQTSLQDTNVTLIYSDALATGDFSKVEYLSKSDALHPSQVGQTHISFLVYQDLEGRKILQMLNKKP